MTETFENILAGIRQWVNGKLEEITYVIALSINSLNSRVTNVENNKQNSLTSGDGISIDSGNTISVVGKQDELTAGSNVTIVSDGSGNTTISAIDTTYQASDFDVKDLTDSTTLLPTTGAMSPNDLYAWYTDSWSDRWAKMSSCVWQKNNDYITVSAMGVRTIDGWGAVYYSLPFAPISGQTASGVVPVEGSSTDVVSWTLTTQTPEQGQTLHVLCLNKLYGGNFTSNGTANIIMTYKYR